MPAQRNDLEWLAAVPAVEPDDATAVGRGRVDFVLGAALAGVNLFVTAALIVVGVLQSAGTIVAGAVDLARGTTAPPLPTESAAAFAIVVAGSLLGLAVGVGGFAVFAWKRWPSYYWPVFGIAISLGSALVASRS
jgi:hypothetical protein